MAFQVQICLKSVELEARKRSLNLNSKLVFNLIKFRVEDGKIKMYHMLITLINEGDNAFLIISGFNFSLKTMYG